MRKAYVDANEEFPTNAPKSHGKVVQSNCYVDSDHAGDRMIQHSQTGIFLVTWSLCFGIQRNRIRSNLLLSESSLWLCRLIRN